MPPKPKFRLFGGPNGSGKTHVFSLFKERGIIHTELYVNADKIEAELKKRRKFYFTAYRVKVDHDSFRKHIIESGLFKEKIKDKSFIDHFSIEAGVLQIGEKIKINSYHASFVATYLAERLFDTHQSFAFETVMSHESKIDLIKVARQSGYKTYLYFIFADAISTNIARVQLRVLRGGHAVEEQTIKSRAPRTFGLLPKAFEAADNAYVIDNSDNAIPILIKEGSNISRAKKFPGIINKAIHVILRRLPKDFTLNVEN
jgi:predicted ABC-type ATPase